LVQKDSTAPLDPGERSAIARLLETAHAALTEERIPVGRESVLLGTLIYAIERAALDVRRGHRAADLNLITADVRDTIAELLGEAQAP
jgi:hypothetical protein